jgi:hypothetical protein
MELSETYNNRSILTLTKRRPSRSRFASAFGTSRSIWVKFKNIRDATPDSLKNRRGWIDRTCCSGASKQSLFLLGVLFVAYRSGVEILEKGRLTCAFERPFEVFALALDEI